MHGPSPRSGGGERGGGTPPRPRRHPFEDTLLTQGFVLLDGGLATALEARGHDLRDPLWSAKVLLEAPAEVRQVHLDYLRAGADCIATVTYQATYEGFRARGLDAERAEAALNLAVRLAAEARTAFWGDAPSRAGRLRPLVAASVGPYGAYLANGAEYTGDYDLDEDALVSWHRRRWHVLAASGADLLACETIPSLAEARAFLRLLAETPGRWAWLSFQCRDGERLADGTPLQDVAALCGGAGGVVAVGVNCVPPSSVSSLLRCARRGTRALLVAYPNSGERYDPSSGRWSAPTDSPAPSGRTPAESPVDLVAWAPRWHAEGAAILGGCCRTGPDTIARMRRALTDARGPEPGPLSASGA
ncbi:MAG: homocysteine S-methyltransferase [Gemmatimonadetes bacterium]|nr:homocysteine S-methyltransferase [Gemmatimonadota bacterium]